MSNEDETRKQAEEDTKEDLELKDEDAGKVSGGDVGKMTVKFKPELTRLIVKGR